MDTPLARGGSPEVVSLLKGLFGSNRKLMIITYNLPVVLRKNRTGACAAVSVRQSYVSCSSPPLSSYRRMDRLLDRR